MQNGNRNTQKQNTLHKLLGTPTPAKASGSVFTLACILPTLLFFVVLLVCGAFGLLGEGYEKKDWFLYVSYLMPQLATALIIVLYYRYTQKDVRKEIKAQKCRWKYFLMAFFLQLGLLSLSELNTWFLEILGKIGYVDGGISLPSVQGFGFVGVFFVVALLAPIAEELLFRGVLLDGIKSTFSTATSVLVCGALFSLYHQNPAQTAYQFCCGVAYALLAFRAGSVLPTIFAHFLNNALVLILYKCGVAAYPKALFIPLMIVSALSLVATLAYLVFVDRKKTDETKACEQQEQPKIKAEMKRFFYYAGVGIFICLLSWISVLVSGI